MANNQCPLAATYGAGCCRYARECSRRATETSPRARLLVPLSNRPLPACPLARDESRRNPRCIVSRDEIVVDSWAFVGSQIVTVSPRLGIGELNDRCGGEPGLIGPRGAARQERAN